MIEKRKNEHNGRGKLCVKPTKYQRITSVRDNELYLKAL